jgi:hypothetical protein
MRRRPIVPLLALVLFALGGCFGPHRVGLADDTPLAEKWRVPNPVPVAAGHTWTLDLPGLGLLGEGRRIARVDPQRGNVGWSLDLSGEYSLTDPARILAITGAVVLLNRDRSRVRVLSTDSGDDLWGRTVPPGSQVFAGSDGGEAGLILAHCTARACTLTGVHAYDGRTVWTSHTGPGALAGVAQQHAVLVVGRRRISWVSADDGKVHWSLDRPPGTSLRVIGGLYRVTLFTPPAAPKCVATFRGVEEGHVRWTRTFPWRDPSTPPGTPCGYAPSRLIVDRFDNIEVPVPGAIEQLDGYHGTTTRMALDPGEYAIDGTLTWTPGVGYRELRSRGTSLDFGPAAVPPPSGPPWIRQQSVPSLWLLRSGGGVALYDPFLRHAEWRCPAVTAVEIASPDRFFFVDGSELAGIGPKVETR